MVDCYECVKEYLVFHKSGEVFDLQTIHQLLQKKSAPLSSSE
jgi:hypothetical protein